MKTSFCLSVIVANFATRLSLTTPIPVNNRRLKKHEKKTGKSKVKKSAKALSMSDPSSEKIYLVDNIDDDVGSFSAADVSAANCVRDGDVSLYAVLLNVVSANGDVDSGHKGWCPGTQNHYRDFEDCCPVNSVIFNTEDLTVRVAWPQSNDRWNNIAEVKRNNIAMCGRVRYSDDEICHRLTHSLSGPTYRLLDDDFFQDDFFANFRPSAADFVSQKVISIRLKKKRRYDAQLTYMFQSPGGGGSSVGSIHNHDGSKCLTLDSRSNFLTFQQCEDTLEQQWLMDEFRRVRNKWHPGKCIVADLSTVHMADCIHDPSYSWTFDPFGQLKSKSTRFLQVRQANKPHDFCLSMTGSGKRARMAPCELEIESPPQGKQGRLDAQIFIHPLDDERFPWCEGCDDCGNFDVEGVWETELISAIGVKDITYEFKAELVKQISTEIETEFTNTFETSLTVGLKDIGLSPTLSQSLSRTYRENLETSFTKTEGESISIGLGPGQLWRYKMYLRNDSSTCLENGENVILHAYARTFSSNEQPCCLPGTYESVQGTAHSPCAVDKITNEKYPCLCKSNGIEQSGCTCLAAGTQCKLYDLTFPATALACGNDSLCCEKCCDKNSTPVRPFSESNLFQCAPQV